MTLEDTRADLLAEIPGGGAALVNRALSSANLSDKRALQQIDDGCFVKLHQVRLLKCDACEEMFHKRSRLMIHYFDTHVNEDLEESDITTGASVDVEKFAPEVANLHNTDNINLKLHPCNICDESFAFKVDMLIHKLKHSGKEPQACVICHKLFLNKTRLKTHINNCHTAENPYTCDVCNKQFQSLIYFKQHKKLHTGIKPYSCEFCNKKFLFKGYMTRHRRRHTGETPYSCVCGRQFPFYSGLKNHRCAYVTSISLRSESELECDYCQRKYQYQATLIKHIKLHMNAEIYSCDHCNLKLKSPSGLKRHIAKHTGDLPHACSVCNSKFTDKYKLTRHMLTHMKEKVYYSCKICNERFANKKTMTKHLKVHTKPYQCIICKKSFCNEKRLDVHLKLSEWLTTSDMSGSDRYLLAIFFYLEIFMKFLGTYFTATALKIYLYCVPYLYEIPDIPAIRYLWLSTTHLAVRATLKLTQTLTNLLRQAHLTFGHAVKQGVRLVSNIKFMG